MSLRAITQSTLRYHKRHKALCVTPWNPLCHSVPLHKAQRGIQKTQKAFSVVLCVIIRITPCHYTKHTLRYPKRHKSILRGSLCNPLCHSVLLHKAHRGITKDTKAFSVVLCIILCVTPCYNTKHTEVSQKTQSSLCYSVQSSVSLRAITQSALRYHKRHKALCVTPCHYTKRTEASQKTQSSLCYSV